MTTVASDTVVQSIASTIDVASTREDEVLILTGKGGGRSGDEGIGIAVREGGEVIP